MDKQKGTVGRRLIHVRQVTCTAYSRDDGLIEIQGILVDTKPFAVALPERGRIEGDEPIHELVLTVVIDRDLIIKSAFAETRRSPYRDCSVINVRYKRLIGMHIGSGFLSQAKRLFHKTDGCSHLTELLGPIATTAYQALWGEPKQGTQDVFHSVDERAFVGCCHALRQNGSVVKLHFPKWYRTASGNSKDLE
jgi:hypothetical protein